MRFGRGFRSLLWGQQLACRYGRWRLSRKLNSKNGPPHAIDFGPDDWDAHTSDDIAVVPLMLDGRTHEVCAIPIGMFSRRDDDEISVGDDVFMIGLYVDHEGRERNNPLARFGNVSMIANANSPVSHNGKSYERHIIDLHSRSGFSGSPVFVYRTFGANLVRSVEDVNIEIGPIASALDPERGNRGCGVVSTQIMPETMFKLLGIHCSQFPEKWKDQKGLEIDGVSGMTCVAPASKILEALMSPKFVTERKVIEQLKRASR